MSSPAVEVKLFLDSLGTLGAIRVGTMPPTPNILGAVYEYGGFPIERKFGVAGVGYEKPSIQIIFRGEPDDYAGPMDKARIAWAALAAVQPGTISGSSIVYLMITPQQSPFPLKDENRRYEAICNYYTMKEPT